MPIWKVHLIIIEDYEVDAPSRKEALMNTENPYDTFVRSATCVKMKKKEAGDGSQRTKTH